MTARAKHRSGLSPRSRTKRRQVCVSVGSGEKSFEQSGNGTAPADLTALGTCTRPPAAAKNGTLKACVYQTAPQDGSNPPMETETPDVTVEPAPPEGALSLVPTEGAALLLNDP